VEAAELLARTRPDVVVDLVSCSFTTGEPAAALLRAALEAGASVVTANKAPLARNWGSLHALAREGGLRIGYSGAAGAALPAVAVARALGRADRIEALEGVLTGTSSYVLAQVAAGTGLADAIAGAQAEGIAEPDPSLDLGGWDTAAKIVILANTVWGTELELDDVTVVGIDDASIAGLEGAAVHLIGRAERSNGAVVADVRPRAVGADDPLAALAPGEKGVSLTGPGIGRVSVSGGRSSPRGAATAVLGDILEILEARA
jgi:homoserine dehydrogenase